jgi:hypothetical protein
VFRSLAPRILSSSTAGIFELMRLDAKQTPIEETQFFDDLVRIFLLFYRKLFAN